MTPLGLQEGAARIATAENILSVELNPDSTRTRILTIVVLLIPGRVLRLLRGFDHPQTTLAAPARGRFDDNLYVPSKRVELSRQPVDGDSLHAALEHFGKRWAICAVDR